MPVLAEFCTSTFKRWSHPLLFSFLPLSKALSPPLQENNYLRGKLCNYNGLGGLLAFFTELVSGYWESLSGKAKSLSSLAYLLSREFHLPALVRTGEGSTSCNLLKHSFIIIPAAPSSLIGVTETTGITGATIIDPNFRDQFRLALEDPVYIRYLEEEVPEVFIGIAGDLDRSVKRICAEICSAFARSDCDVPPWRKTSSLLSKWHPRRFHDEHIMVGPATAPHNSSLMGQTNSASSELPTAVVRLTKQVDRQKAPPVCIVKTEPLTSIRGFFTPAEPLKPSSPLTEGPGEKLGLICTTSEQWQDMVRIATTQHGPGIISKPSAASGTRQLQYSLSSQRSSSSSSLADMSFKIALSLSFTMGR